jgi:hypothetical protein
MIVTDQELAGLNSMSGGGPLPGLLLPSMTEADTQPTLDSLQAQGVIDHLEQLTDFGFIPVRLVEQYRKASRHVFINQIKISLNDDGQLTVLQPDDRGWRLARMSPAVLMLALLKAFPFLRRGSSPSDTGPWEPVTWDEWAAFYVTEPGASVLVTRSVVAGEAASPAIAYSTRAGVGYSYDLASGLAKTLPIRDIRTRLAALIGFEEPVAQEGSHHG